MTPEQKIVEVAVKWRKAQFEVREAGKATKEVVKRPLFSISDYQDACTQATLKQDIVTALKAELTDLLDKYIGENP